MEWCISLEYAWSKNLSKDFQVMPVETAQDTF